MPPTMDPIEALTQVPASDVKKHGWRGVMRALKVQGRVVVTNHDEPQAVIISADEYGRLVQIVRHAESQIESELEALRQRFDQRLAVLQAPDAGDRLRGVVRGPAKLRGRVKAGTSV